MKVRILPSSADQTDLQHLITLLVDGHLAIDAGCLGLWGSPADQAGVTGVVLTHSHADHVCSLPMFVMNVADHAGRGVTVHAPRETIEVLRHDVFNGRIWPDFTAVRIDDRPLLEFRRIEPGQPMRIDGLTVTAIPVNHPVPTVAYLVDDGTAAVLAAADMAPTPALWEAARANPRLRAVFLDVAFPDEEGRMAERSGHLTPRLAHAEVARLPGDVARIAVHLKPAFRRRIVEQLTGDGPSGIAVGRIGHTYEL